MAKVESRLHSVTGHAPTFSLSVRNARFCPVLLRGFFMRRLAGPATRLPTLLPAIKPSWAPRACSGGASFPRMGVDVVSMPAVSSRALITAALD